MTPGLKSIRTIEELNVKGKRVFLRCDFNVPLQGSDIADPFRIDQALPAIQYLLDHGAKVILSSHLGRPKGENDKHRLSMLPIGQYLQEKLKKEVVLLESPSGDGIKGLLSDNTKQIYLLENSRFDPGEEKNSMEMAAHMASFTDVYVSEAFGAVHRAHATTQALPSLVKEKGIGFLMKKEIENLDKILHTPQSPFVAILGGAKVSDKIKIIDNLVPKIDTLIIGGAMAYTFLSALDVQVGKSLVEKDKVQTAKEIIERIRLRKKTLLLPVDHVVAAELKAGVPSQTTPTQAIPSGLMGLDIGPKTIAAYKAALGSAKTVFWNGPMGAFETPPFETGTFALAKAIAELKATTIVGGGDSANAVKEAGVSDKISHISTGGGASLEYLEGVKLPGIEVLRSEKSPDAFKLEPFQE